MGPAARAKRHRQSPRPFSSPPSLPLLRLPPFFPFRLSFHCPHLPPLRFLYCTETNCRSGKGLGLAKILFERFPHANVYAERRPFVKGTQYSVPGTIEVRGHGPGPDNRGVINLMGQDAGGPCKRKGQREARAEYFALGLSAIAALDDLTSIAFPHNIGCGIAGARAGELIQTWVLAMSENLKIGAVAQMIVPYPTLGEVSKRAAGSFYTPSLFSERTRKIVRFLRRFG